MAIVTPDLLKELMRTYKRDFERGLGQAPSQYKKVASVIPSGSASNVYGWLGRFPSMREWIGSRVIQNMASSAYRLDNVKYEGTVGVLRTDIEDDNLGIYAPMFEEMGRAAQEHPDIEVFKALTQGFDTPCYDGQNFFDDEHPVYPNVDGSGTPALVSNIFMPDAAYVGPVWYLLDCHRAIKPLIYQERTKPELTTTTAEQNDHTFMTDEYLYGVRMRNAVGFSFWQMAVAGKAELNSDNLWDAISKMRGFRTDGDKRLGMKATHLVVPPELEKQATRMLERELDASMHGTTSNELRGRLELIVADYLD